MRTTPNTKIGVIIEKNSIVMSLAVCEVGDDETQDRFSFDLANFNSPMITSKKTGKRFILPLRDLVTMALDAGIEVEDKPQCTTSLKVVE